MLRFGKNSILPDPAPARFGPRLQKFRSLSEQSGKGYQTLINADLRTRLVPPAMAEQAPDCRNVKAKNRRDPVTAGLTFAPGLQNLLHAAIIMLIFPLF